MIIYLLKEIYNHKIPILEKRIKINQSLSKHDYNGLITYNCNISNNWDKIIVNNYYQV